jgi:hypothetical protein
MRGSAGCRRPRPACGERSDCIEDAIRVRGASGTHLRRSSLIESLAPTLRRTGRGKRKPHPTGKSAKTCPAPFRKIFRFACRANQSYQLAPSHPPRGADRESSRTRDGMRWTRQRRRASVFAGRSSVSERRRARRTTLLSPSTKLRRTCTSLAKRLAKTGRVRQNRVVLAPVAGVKSAEARSAQPGLIVIQSAGDGDKGIRRRGERGISRKAIAQGMPDCLR